MPIYFRILIWVIFPGLIATFAHPFELSAQKCFGDMRAPGQVWNEYMIPCFNKENATSCSLARSNSRNAECLHDISLELAKMLSRNGDVESAHREAGVAFRHFQTADAALLLAVSVIGLDQPVNVKIADIDKATSVIGSNIGALTETQREAFEYVKRQRALLSDSVRVAAERRTAAVEAGARDLESLKARCPAAPRIDGRPLFVFGHGAANYEREVLNYALLNSSGIRAELHDKRQADNFFGQWFAQAETFARRYICVKSVKYIKHVTTQSGPGGQKIHVAEIEISAVGRKQEDLNQRIELPYSD